MDVLEATVPEGIPGALFAAMTKVLLKHYKPGTIINTAQGAGTKAQNAAVDLLEVMTEFYAAVASEEQ